MNLPSFALLSRKHGVSFRALRYCALAAAVGATWQAVCAAALPPTQTSITVSSGAGAVTTVAAGSIVTLTAIVTAGSTPVIVGQVNFCDASASYCTDIHRLGTAQLTSAGTAVFKFRPGIGTHSYKAVFAGTNMSGSSSSTASTVAVTGTVGTFATSTTIAETGSWGNYALTATVTESGGTLSPTGAVSFLDTSNGNAVLASPTLGAAIAGVDWPNPQQLNVSNATEAVALGDFNGDGIADVAAIAGTLGQPLVILLGNADGSYTTAPALALPTYNLGPMVVADFNGDGKQDLAVLNPDMNAVIILLGNGDGTFQTAASSPAVAQTARQIVAGDFNGDGVQDLVVLAANLTILLGNGDGTFTATPAGSSDASNAYIALGDFNQDGKLDLAITSTYLYAISILLGNGDGTFAEATDVAIGSSNSPIAVADFNGDGHLDIAVGATNPNVPSGTGDLVNILDGNGDGTFSSVSSGQGVAAGSVTSINVGDFNSDGSPDLALTDGTGTLTVFVASGSGSFTAYPTTLFSGEGLAVVCAAGDLNGDGRSDLALAGYGPTVSLLTTEPTETAAVTTNIILPSGGQHLVDASYGGDSTYTPSVSSALSLWGVPPVSTTTLTVSYSGSPVTSVAPGSVVTLTATVAAGGNPLTAGQVSFCDASSNQCADIHLLGTSALTSNGTATFLFVPGTGTHTYKAVFVQDGYGASSSSAASTLTVGPAKSPVYTDTTSISWGGQIGEYSFTGTVTGYGGAAAPTGNVSFLDTSFGNAVLGTAPLGPATAGLGWLISQTPAAPSNLFSEVTGDFNGDGLPDLAVAWSSSSGTAAFSILFGRTDGTFATGPTTQTQASNQSATTMIVGDFNGDGKTDLALLTYPFSTADTVTTYLGNGDGTFTASAPSTVFNQGPVGGEGVPGFMVAADFNGDGRLDLAVVGDYTAQGGVTIVLGNGDGTFTAAGPNLEPNQAFDVVATGDFNGDGIPDLITIQAFSSNLGAVFLGKGDGTFTATFTGVTLEQNPSSIVCGDVNGDGKTDLVFGYNGGIDVFLGNGDGSFHHAPGSPIDNLGGDALVGGDFNHDGKMDFAGINNGALNQIYVYLGAGDGTFTTNPTTPSVSQAFLTNPSLVAADFNADGVPDLALVESNQPTATIFLTQPTQTASATVNGVTPVGAGTHNVVASYAGDSNYNATVSTPIPISAALAPVVFSPAASTYSSAQSITLSEAISGATIYYWLSGPLNTNGQGTNGYVPYRGPIQLSQGGVESVKAYATESGYQQSAYSSATYYLDLPVAPTPVIAPAGGTYPGAQAVTIADSAPGATIYYTIDGSVPTPASAKYSGAIMVSSSQTVAAIAVASGYSNSLAQSAQYLIGSSRSAYIYTVAGNGNAGYSGDGGLATAAQLDGPTVSILDSAGNVYFADSYNNVVREVAATTGIVTTVAGNGTPGYSGDNGPATSAQLYDPSGLALDSAGNLYIADSGNNVVRQLSIATGVIKTIAGTGAYGFSGDGGPAINARLFDPTALALDSTGNLFIADVENHRIREIAAKTGVITTVAGSQQYGYSGDGGPATSAQLRAPNGVALDGAGNLYIADTNNHVIRKVIAGSGVISTFAGTGYGSGSSGGYSGDGGPATSAEFNYPEGVAVDSSGDLYIADSFNQVIRMVSASNGTISTVAGDRAQCNSLGGDGGPATSAGLCYPWGISVDRSGDLYIVELGWGRIREALVSRLPPTAQTAAPIFSVPAGTYAAPQTVTITDSTPGAALYVTLDGSTPNTARVGYLGPITVSGDVTIKAIAVASGHLTSAPVTAAYIVTSKPTAVIATVAGDGGSGFFAGGGQPLKAQFGSLTGVALDKAGNLFFADSSNNVVWEIVSKTGAISIVAGTGTPGYLGDGGLATSAQLSGPNGLAVDGSGNLYIADSNNNVVRKVAAVNGVVTTYAGNGQNYGNVGDGGQATSAQLLNPTGLAVDTAGNLYIADSYDNLVRVVSASTGVITSIAGVGNAGGSVIPGAPTTAATVQQPVALALDGSGNLYIAFAFPSIVRKVTMSTGIVTTVAGDGNFFGSSGDGGPATKANTTPNGLAVDSAGNLYLSDIAEIRLVSARTGLISRIAGNGYVGYSGDGGSATVAEIAFPQGIALDASGNLYLADVNNHRLREVFSSTHSFAAPTVTLTLSAANISAAQALSVTVAVSSAGPTPTGSVTLGSGSYSAQQALANGTSTFNLAAGSLPVGANTLTATYEPDNTSAGTYTTASQSATVTVALAIGSAIASVTLSPSATTITDQQAITVATSVTGGSGQATPTGTVTLVSGSYSSQQPLANSGASFSIPAGALTAANNTLTANYSGDDNYATASGTTTITVVPLVVAVPTPPAVAPGSTATATATFSAGSTYSGTLNLTCALTASPSGAKSLPTCTLNPASVTIASGGNATTMVTVDTTKASTLSALHQWGGEGALVLAFLIAAPSLRRRKKTMLFFVFAIAITAVNGCGSGGSGGSGPSSPGTPATSSGSYTFQVTATDALNAKITASANLTVTVQ